MLLFRVIIIILFELFLAHLASAQAPPIQWQKSYGGSDDDFATSVYQTSDGGYIVTGDSYSIDGDVTGNHGGVTYSDAWVLRLDNSGNIQWKKCLGGTDSDALDAVQQTAEGGYILAGGSRSNDGDVTGHHGTNMYTDYWVVKLDGVGGIQWQKSLGGSYEDEAWSVQQTFDFGYIVAGWSESLDGDVTGIHGYYDYWVVKLDSIGNIQWQKTLGGMYHETAWFVNQTSDSGFVVTGYSESNDGNVTGNHGSEDYWVVKLDGMGNIQWQKCLGGSQADAGKTIQQTNDGGYIMSGWSRSTDGDVTGNHGGWDYWIVKLDSAGNIQWQKCLGGTADEGAWRVQQTFDGGYIAGGWSHSNDGDVTGHHGTFTMGDYWVVKLDSNGTLQWQESLGGTTDDESYFLQQTNDGGFILVGGAQSNDGDVVGHHGSNQYNDFWIVKLDNANGIKENANAGLEFTISPNPTSNNFTISVLNSHQKLLIEIINVFGEIVYTENFWGEGNYIVDASFSSGIYFVNVNDGENNIVRKLIVD